MPAHRKSRTGYGKKSWMGSENRQRSFRGNLKSSVTRSIAPKRVALENRRYLPERLLLPQSTAADMQTEAQSAERHEYLTSSATYAVKKAQTWGELTASWRTSETSLSAPPYAAVRAWSETKLRSSATQQQPPPSAVGSFGSK